MYAKGFDERTLKTKLANIPEREMIAYHTQRMKRYRIYFIVAIVCGVVSAGSIFAFPNLAWISLIFAVLGIIVLGWGSYQRERWRRLFENLLYLKRSHHAPQDERRHQDKHITDKFTQLKKEP